jgi:colanic acid/amylovoran biosynthesis protein
MGFWNALRRCDLAISSGGGYFYSHRRLLPGPTFYQNILHVRAALAMGKPVVFFPQSFGPCLSAAAAGSLSRILRHPGVRAILCREDASREFLRTILPADVFGRSVAICLDAAFLLAGTDPPETPHAAADGSGPLIAVTLRTWTPTRRRRRGKSGLAPEDAYLQALEDALAEIRARRNASIVVVPHSRGPRPVEDDRPISRRFLKRLRRRLGPERISMLDVADDAEPEALIAFFGRADLVLASRFHSAIFALDGGTPALAIGYQPKARGTLKILGFEHWNFDREGLRGSDLAVEAERIFSAGAGLRAEIAERRERARAAVKAALDRALEGILP